MYCEDVLIVSYCGRCVEGNVIGVSMYNVLDVVLVFGVKLFDVDVICIFYTILLCGVCGKVLF